MSRDDANPQLPHMPKPGEVLDERYRLGEAFASGAMGVILKAEQIRTGRQVAVKLLHSHIASQKDFAQRFKREVRVATLFDHPNIVRVYDVGETDAGALYLVMELLEGEELKELIDREAPLAVGRTVDIVLQMLDGLAEAHSQEVIHRDLKPANVQIVKTRRGHDHVKLLDFGVAKLVNSGRSELTATGVYAGTPPYIAPEMMFVGADTERPTLDVYAAGLVMLEMLTAKRVFEGDGISQTLLQHLKKPVRIPESIDTTPLGAVLRRATAKHPADRYSNADELYIALDAIRDDLPDELRLDPHETPGAFSTTSASILQKVTGKDADLAVLHDVPQHETYIPDDEPTLPTIPTGPAEAALSEGSRSVEQVHAKGASDSDLIGPDEDTRVEVQTPDFDGDEPTQLLTDLPGQAEETAEEDPFEVGPTQVYEPDDSRNSEGDSAGEPLPEDTRPDTTAAPDVAHADTSHEPVGSSSFEGRPPEQQQTVVSAVDPPDDQSSMPASLRNTCRSWFLRVVEGLKANPKESLIGFGIGVALLGGVIVADSMTEEPVDDEPSDHHSGVPPEGIAESIQELDGHRGTPAAQEDDQHDDTSQLELNITTQPTGAGVIADGNILGETPIQLRIPRKSGPDALLLEKEGYQHHRIELTDQRFDDEQTATLDIELQPTSDG